jgi:hypothetical protein
MLQGLLSEDIFKSVIKVSASCSWALAEALTLLKFINNQEFLMEVFLCFFLFTIVTVSMFIDMAVYDTTCAVTIGIPSPEAAQSVLNKLELSGHVVFAEADARYLYVKANCAGGRRPNLVLWGSWKEVSDLSLLYGVVGFYFGEQWYRPSVEAQGKRKKQES